MKILRNVNQNLRDSGWYTHAYVCTYIYIYQWNSSSPTHTNPKCLVNFACFGMTIIKPHDISVSSISWYPSICLVLSSYFRKGDIPTVYPGMDVLPSFPGTYLLESQILAHLGDRMIFKPIAHGCVAVYPPRQLVREKPIINPGAIVSRMM